MIDLSVTVLHYNRWDLTKDCLASIDAQEIPCRYEKILIDNGSACAAGTIVELVEEFPAWRVIRSEQNCGNIGGQNLCFQHAQGSWVLFIANDVRLHEATIANLMGATSQDRYQRLGQLQPPCERPDGSIDQCGLVWRWPGYGVRLLEHARQHEIPCVASTCYLMQKSVWQKIGRFDEQLISSHEDIDMGLRLRRGGYSNLLVPYYARVTHLMNQTLQQTILFPRRNFHRDRCYVIRKHYHGSDRLLRLAAVHILDSLPRL